MAMTVRRFRPYPAYKDSRVEWLGKIPLEWQAKPLKYLTQFSTGWTPATGREDLYGGKHLWANISDLGPKVLHTTEKTISDLAIREARLQIVPVGSLLFSFKLSVGTVSIAGVDMYTNEAIAAFQPSERIDTQYLYWAAPVLVPQNAQANIYGAPLLSRERIANARLLSPPIPEQHAIAEFLDRETAKIDVMVAMKERLIELLQEKRAALITHAVTKGLDPDVPMKDSGVEWLGKIPADWEAKRIKFIAKVGNGSTPSRENADYWGGQYPWLNSGVANHREVTEASDFVTDLALAECHLPRVHPPAVLVAITGEGKTRGMATLLRIEATINQHLAFIRPARSDCDAEYIRYVFHAAYQFLRDESGGGGSTKGALTCDQLESMTIPFPPASEQRTIISFLDKESAKLDALIAKVLDAIDHLKELRTALISAAVTGKIDVREEVA